jgi:hypothetical protein
MSSRAASLPRNRQKVVDLVLPLFTVKYMFPREVMAAIMFKENGRCEWEENVRRP